MKHEGPFCDEGEAINCRRFPYVCPYRLTFPTKAGPAAVERGFLSDGASGDIVFVWRARVVRLNTVRELSRPGFMKHDHGYLIGGRIVDGVFMAFGKLEIDWEYHRDLWKAHHYRAAVRRFIGLQNPYSWCVAWRRHRADVRPYWQKLEERMLPEPAAYDYPDDWRLCGVRRRDGRERH